MTEDLQRQVDYWRGLYELERKQRLIAEDTIQQIIESRRSERPEQLANESEFELCQR